MLRSVKGSMEPWFRPWNHGKGAPVMSSSRPLFVPFALALCASEASAYESDPLSARRDPPADATIVANAHATEMLSGAIDRVNAATQCKGDDHEMHLAVAKEISRTMTENRTDPSRGCQPQSGCGRRA